MDTRRKLWVFLLVVGCILMLQYHVSTGIGRPGNPPLSSADVDELIKSAISKLQLDPMFTSVIGERYLHNLGLQLAKILYSNCYGSIAESREPGFQPEPEPDPEPSLYIITPTYRRPEQLPDLTRLAQTLMHVRNLVWLVIEDSKTRTPLITQLLDRTGINYHHLVAPMPSEFASKKVKPKGVSNRNRGLKWIRANATSGVLYFADDDNTYDIAVFEEIRTTKKVSMFPVGLCTKLGVSSPVVRKGKFAGFYDGWIGGRKFPVDMAGFAVNVEFLHQRPKASMPYAVGFEEDGFLKSLKPFEPKEIELKADNCTKILVWHTQTKANRPSEAVNMRLYNNTNIVKLKEILV